MTNLKAWIMQPSTVSGIGSVATVLVGLAVHYATHDTTATVAIGLAVGGLVKIALPDNTGAQNSVEKLVMDAVSAAATHSIAAQAPALMQDALAAFRSLPATRTVTTAATASNAAGSVTESVSTTTASNPAPVVATVQAPVTAA